MKLAHWMTREGLDDEDMAKKVRTRRVKCDRSMIFRYRCGMRRPGWPVIIRIAAVTNNQVTANDWMFLRKAA